MTKQPQVTLADVNDPTTLKGALDIALEEISRQEKEIYSQNTKITELREAHDACLKVAQRQAKEIKRLSQGWMEDRCELILADKGGVCTCKYAQAGTHCPEVIEDVLGKEEQCLQETN